MLAWALAQAAVVAVAPASAAAPAQEGVTSYPASFFAGAHPNTASDMIRYLPGFSLDTGAGVRGYEGAAGNVLIDGQRPATKSEGIDALLSRLLASRVERIDVIRGGAPGIDMQGKTVIANVILKADAGLKGVLAESNYVLSDGRFFVGQIRAEASGAVGPRTWELAGHYSSGPDDSVSTGRSLLTHADGSAPQAALLDSKGLDVSGTATASGETPLFGGRLRLNGRLAQ